MDFIESFEWQPPTAEDFDETSYKAEILGDFLAWATESGVTTVGGLPTNPNDEAIPDELIKKLCTYYESRGHAFIALENRSQYPREYFYDTPHHLAEEYQIQHSRKLAYRLKEPLSGDSGRHTQQSANDCVGFPE